MSKQQFEIDTRQLERLSSELAAFPKDLRSAMRSSLTTGIRKSLTTIVPKYYAINQSKLTRVFKVIDKRYSGTDDESVSFEVFGRRLTLEHFYYSPQRHKTFRPMIEIIKGHKKKAGDRMGEDGEMKTPFVINAPRQSGGGRIKNIFVPLGRPSQRNPQNEALKSYRTVSVPQMLGHHSVADEIQENLLEVFDETLFKRIERRTGVMQQNISKG